MSVIGVDLDETIITTNSHKGKITWEIKKKANIWLVHLYKSGFKFHLISARENYYDVCNIAKSIENTLNIKFESVIVTSYDKKGAFAKNVGCCIMIDDNPDYLADCNQHGVVPILLIRSKHKYQRVYPSYIICENWDEVGNCIINKDK